MVQGELQPEIAELTFSSYRSRPASGRCPSLHPRLWPQPSLCCSGVGLIPGKGGESWCIPDKCLPGSLLSCSGDNRTHVYSAPSTWRAAHPHFRATSPEERALGTGCSACERQSSSSNLAGAALSWASWGFSPRVLSCCETGVEQDGGNHTRSLESSLPGRGNNKFR